MATTLSGVSNFRNTGGTDSSSVTRKPTKFVVSDSIEPGSRETRMKWLYNTITSYGLDYEFSEPARQWIKERVATHDMSTRRDRSGSSWWERESSTKSGIATETLPNLPSGNSNVSVSSNSTVSNSSTSTNSAANRSPSEFLTNQNLCEAFTEQLDPADEEVLLVEFLTSFVATKVAIESCSESDRVSGLLSDLFSELSRAFFGSSNNNIFVNQLSLPTEKQRSIRDRVEQAAKKGRKIDPNVDNLSIFDELIEAIFKFYESEITDFFNSDLSNVSAETSSVTYASGGSDYIHNVARVNLSQILTSPFTSWDNVSQYRSVTLSVRFGRGPMIQAPRSNQLYLVASSGSRMYKGNMAAGSWNETFILPISPTTQNVTIVVGNATKVIGFLPLSLAELNPRPEVGLVWYDLRSEEHPGLAVGPGLGTPFNDTNDLSANTANNQIAVEWKLSTEEAPPCLERFKSIYVDETATGGLGDFIRGKVSKKKKRFSDDNFNLDLTYILPNIIAMGFPSEGTEGMYRNPLKQVQQFFLLRHTKCYRIYNLCSERTYDHAKFEHCAQHFPFHDHNPPPFTMIKDFCENARSFLAQHPQNVISIHCKAGKGRTGTMIAALLVYSGHFTSQSALEYFGKMRTSNSKGVTIPSQIRYVHYFGKYCDLRRAGMPAPGQTTLFLSSIRINNIGKMYGNADVFFSLHQLAVEENNGGEAQKGKSFVSRKIVEPKRIRDSLVWDFSKKLIDLSEDFKLEFQVRNAMGNKDKLFHCWFNTRFMKLEISPQGEPHIIVPKAELDKAVKDCKTHKKYPVNMNLEMIFANVATATKIKDDELSAKN